MLPIYLIVQNTRTAILNASPAVLEEVDRVTSYLTEELVGARPAVRYNLEDQDLAWDGWVRFLDTKTSPPTFPSGLRDIVYAHLQRLGLYVLAEDRRQVPEQDVPLYPNPIPLWDHQQACREAMLVGGDVVAVMPPRSGKTRTMLEVVRSLSLPTLWIAPTTAIVTQTIREARKWFKDFDAVQVSKATWEEQRNALLWVCTSAGMLTLPPEAFKTRQHLAIDECHHLLEHKSWGSYLQKNTDHIFHRKGMSGTWFRSSKDDLALLAFIGRQGYRISSQALLDKGLLVPTYMIFVPIQGKPIKATSKEWLAPGGVGTLGLHQHTGRLDAVAMTAGHLAQLGRTTVVLVATKAQGYEVQKRLRSYFPPKAQGVEFEAVEFCSTDRPKKVIQEIFKSFTAHGAVKVLIGTSMVGEGVDLPTADALVNAVGGKAAVSLTQAFYRVATASPGKAYAVIVDFIDHQHKTLLEHSRGRWAVASSDPVFTCAALSSPHEFPSWAANTQVPKKGDVSTP